MLGGTTRNQDSHIQQTPDNQLRLQEILTLILETLDRDVAVGLGKVGSQEPVPR